jgi:hypothetical protein
MMMAQENATCNGRGKRWRCRVTGKMAGGGRIETKPVVRRHYDEQ